jgi:hypothetical protein
MATEVNAVIVHPDTNAEIKYIRTDLDTLQGIVGGLIEPIGPEDDAYGDWRAYCNEEGKVYGLRYNPVATRQAAAMGWPGVDEGDFLVGTVVFVGDYDQDGDLTDVPDPVLKHFLDLYRAAGAVDYHNE